MIPHDRPGDFARSLFASGIGPDREEPDMVRYVLRCEEAHKFEAWFRSPADSERALASGETVCPVCERLANGSEATDYSVRRVREPAYQ